MGTANGKLKNNIVAKFDPSAPEPYISESEIKLLRHIWDTLKEDISKVGVITFVNLFETHPEVQDVFMSRKTTEMSEVEFNGVLRAHALRVMDTVDKCISRLGKKDRLKHLMTDLGVRHKNYPGIKLEYIDLIGSHFITSIKPHLASIWSREQETAWKHLFKLMEYHMKKGLCSI